MALSAKKAVLSVGDTKELKAAVAKDAASAFTFSSSNEAVATVDENVVAQFNLAVW